MWRLTALLLLLAVVPAAHAQQAKTRTLSYRVYLDKVQGGWTGKAIGLAIGVPKEYNEPWPPSDFDYFAQIPTHFSDLASGDDVYVPLVFQLALKKYGIGASQQEFLQEWHERLFSGRIWVSCEQALDHFRAGVKPPKTGMPGYNSNWDDMCSQTASGTECITSTPSQR